MKNLFFCLETNIQSFAPVIAKGAREKARIAHHLQGKATGPCGEMPASCHGQHSSGCDLKFFFLMHLLHERFVVVLACMVQAFKTTTSRCFQKILCYEHNVTCYLLVSLGAKRTLFAMLIVIVVAIFKPRFLAEL